MKQNVQQKAAKKQRQSQLPLQHAKRTAKSARAENHLYVCLSLTRLAVKKFLEVSSIDVPVSDALLIPTVNRTCDACRSPKQQKVLNTSDAALVKECKDILSKSAAGTGAQQQPSDKEEHKQDASVFTQPQVVLDIMDADTQLLEVLPHVTLKYEAAHQPGPAQCPADHSQQQNNMSFALPAEAAAPAEPADMHDSQPQSEPKGELRNSSLVTLPSVTADLAADSLLTGANMKQPPAGASTLMVQPDPLSAAPPASNKGGSSIDALLQAMLTGELA